MRKQKQIARTDKKIYILTVIQTDRKAHTQTDRETDILTDRETDRETIRQTYKKCVYIGDSLITC